MRKLILILFLTLTFANATQQLDLKVNLSKNEKKSLEIRLTKFKKLVKKSINLSDELKIKRVNHYFNKYYKYVSDYNNYKKGDYWATRAEFILNGSGDCEDYVAAKYQTLIELGIKKEKLQITYGLYKGVNHLTLAYKGSKGLIYLDNNSKYTINEKSFKLFKTIYILNTSIKSKNQSLFKNLVLNNWLDVMNRSRRS